MSIYIYKHIHKKALLSLAEAPQDEEIWGGFG